jgi:hypothetical protein
MKNILLGDAYIEARKLTLIELRLMGANKNAARHDIILYSIERILRYNGGSRPPWMK